MGLFGDGAPADAKQRARGPCIRWFTGRRVSIFDGVRPFGGTVRGSAKGAMTITIAEDGGQHAAFRIDETQQLRVLHRHRRTGLGALFGALAGSVVGVVIACASGCEETGRALGGGRAGVGFGIGALIGVLAGTVIGSTIVEDHWDVVIGPVPGR